MPTPSSIILVNPLYIQKAKEFLDHLQMLGHAKHGARTKTMFLKEFLHYCEVNGIQELQAITAPAVNDYYGYISQRPSKRTGEKLSGKTTFNHTRAIELFFIMLQSKGEVTDNPTATLQFPYPAEAAQTRNILTQEEIKELYANCIHAEERAILSLAYGCGLRVGEMVAVNIDDIKLRENILIVPAGKFNKRRVIPMSTGVVKDLENYFYQVRIYQEPKDYKAFILDSRNKRMQDETYNDRLKVIIKRTNNPAITAKQITIHNLRHSIATHLLENKMPLEQVRIFLGHKQLESTEVYTHVSAQQLKEMIYNDG